MNHQPLTLLALGNPTLGKEAEERVKFVRRGEALTPLPQAENEVRALAQVYGKERSQVYVGAEAREDRVKSEGANYRILHFATHGMLNDVSPMYSHLVLAQSGGVVSGGVVSSKGTDTNHRSPITNHQSPFTTHQEDGLLEAHEIINLDLKADLVVLSACETARGKVSAGEGVIGLTWALFVAGCPSTVASQWKVADESTAALMLEFHRQLKSGKSKAQALRAAQLALLQRQPRWKHPYYWAPFVLIGD